MTLIQSKPKQSQSFPNYEATEDFLDFSRWQLPDERVITKRLSNNAKRFSGNYFCLYLILSVAYALFMNWRILTAATIIVGGGLLVRHFYFYIYILEANDSYQGLEKKNGGSGSHPSKTSAAIYGGIAAVFVLYQFSVMTPLIVTLFVTMVIASIHAVARPFVGERAYLLRPPHS